MILLTKYLDNLRPFTKQLKNDKELDMCLWNTDAPGGNKVKIWQNL